VGAGTNGSTLTLNNVIVTHNQTIANMALNTFGEGGGIALAGSGTVTLNGCVVSGNTAGGSGGGIVADEFGSRGSIIVNNSTLTGNAASVRTMTGSGGAIDVVSGRAGSTTIMVTGSTLNGNSAQAGGAINHEAAGSITIQNSTITGNTAAIFAGAVGNFGGAGVTCNITISQSLFSDNRAGAIGQGGAIDAINGTLMITDSEFSDNVVAGSGGAIACGFTATLTVVATTFDGNTANGEFPSIAIGGALYYNSSSTSSTLTNVTMTGNLAGDLGGAIGATGGTLTLTNCTITNNTVTSGASIGGGGIASSGGAPPALVVLANTIVAGNFASVGPDIRDNFGTFVSNGGNFIGTASGSTSFVAQGSDQVGGTATAGILNLGPLANNGGPLIGAPGSQVTLPTIAELPGSTTIDRGNTVVLLTDERGPGFKRPDEAGAPDIGAFEVQDATLSIAVTPSSSTVFPGQGVSFVITVANTSGTALPDDNSTVTVTLSANLTITTTPPGATVNGQKISFRLGAIGANNSAAFLVNATANATGSGLVNTTISSPDTSATPAGALISIVNPPPPPSPPLPPAVIPSASVPADTVLSFPFAPALGNPVLLAVFQVTIKKHKFFRVSIRNASGFTISSRLVLQGLTPKQFSTGLVVNGSSALDEFLPPFSITNVLLPFRPFSPILIAGF
jgi:predicted outer membrane repeat protein